MTEVCENCLFMQRLPAREVFNTDADGRSTGGSYMDFRHRCRRFPAPVLVDETDWCGEWRATE